MNFLAYQIAADGPQIVTTTHFEDCYIYEGHHCSCGGNYHGSRPGTQLSTTTQEPPR